MQMNAAAAYQNNKIRTASSAELTLMLYEGAIKFCNIAISSIEDQNISKANLNIIKAEKIITELRSNLDFEYPVAQDFDNLYIYIYGRLVQANIRKNKDLLVEALEHLRGIRDTWKEVMKLGKVT